jgi:arylformamidase
MTARYDVSMPLFAGMPAFPADPRFSTETDRAIGRGDAYNLSRISLGTHAGTHVDPPVHFLAGGVGIDGVDLELLNGPCEVVRVPDSRPRIQLSDVAAISGECPRVLFRTANSARWARDLTFFPDYVALDAEAAQFLLERKVGLVGIDALSIESDLTGEFPVHHRLLAGGALILEGLLLHDVPPGRYDLECLPLRLRGGDGGPARAVLRSR